MGDIPTHSLIWQVAELLRGVYGSDRHRPSMRAPKDAEIFGVLSEHAKKLYMLRADQREVIAKEFSAYKELGAKLNARCPDRDTVPGILSIVKAGEDPDFRKLLEWVRDCEEVLMSRHPLTTVIEVLYDQEVRNQFPALRDKKFSIDSQWKVFHRKDAATSDIMHAFMNALNERA